ncbi:MAG: protein-export chaperone SecB [Oceanospirillaceae bacterium]|jgi:preprotein translocase subunit SecB|uniref:protein-export chaperone SecB n=1 Tax=Marinobacterium litorale TaxID=404770 RepID=UPI00041B597E|nr:protein-export chaperone SecB [Marinobacterium litorale]MBS99851.1 protein-export chaperone SecB [Oceanospirillaceae bacterium]
MSENQKQPQFAMKRVYMKDASLETPAAPQVFTKAWQPEVNLDLNTRSTPLDEDHFEVVLTLTVTVKNDGETAFLVEVQQAGIFMLSGLGEAETKHTLGAFCPNILFPYAREAIDNLASKASFPALMLAPVNFDALYAQQQQQAQQKAAEEKETH